MRNISSLKSSSKTFSMMPSSVSTRSRSFQSQFVMSTTIVILLVGFCPSVSSSPTRSLTSIKHNNKINYQSNGYMLDPIDYQTTSRDDSLLSPTVQHSLSGPSPHWYVEPRTHANQFLMSHINDNQFIVPKWFTRLNNNDQINDDDLDDYIPSNMMSNKRSATTNNGGYSSLKKRKQLTKPPMEVMNEIVNSIYLRR